MSPVELLFGWMKRRMYARPSEDMRANIQATIRTLITEVTAALVEAWWRKCGHPLRQLTEAEAVAVSEAASAAAAAVAGH